jgi:hypothetical protein
LEATIWRSPFTIWLTKGTPSPDRDEWQNTPQPSLAKLRPLGACLRAEDINLEDHTICFTRKKLKSRGANLKPTLFRFGTEIEPILKQLPTTGQLFP